MTLYHFTCEHGMRDIIADGGMLRPGVGDRLGLLWLTDMELPLRKPLGLTMNHTPCDRTAYRFRVLDETYVQSWIQFRRSITDEAKLSIAWQLELVEGVMPRHWFVTQFATPSEYDPIGG